MSKNEETRCQDNKGRRCCSKQLLKKGLRRIISSAWLQVLQRNNQQSRWRQKEGNVKVKVREEQSKKCKKPLTAEETTCDVRDISATSATKCRFFYILIDFWGEKKWKKTKKKKRSSVQIKMRGGDERVWSHVFSLRKYDVTIATHKKPRGRPSSASCCKIHPVNHWNISRFDVILCHAVAAAETYVTCIDLSWKTFLNNIHTAVTGTGH